MGGCPPLQSKERRAATPGLRLPMPVFYSTLLCAGGSVTIRATNALIGQCYGLSGTTADVLVLTPVALQRAILPPERMDGGLAGLGVEELVEMGEHRHG